MNIPSPKVYPIWLLLKQMIFSDNFKFLLLVWLVIIILTSALLMWLWNSTITKIFNIRKITYFEALKLLIIAMILFGKGFNLNFALNGIGIGI